jgi:peptide/nickel transport system ATP-binding protein
MAVLLITHDLALVADMADEVIVMYKGQIVEQGTTQKVLRSPQHPYTKALLACRPAANSKGKRLPVISDFIDREDINSATPAAIQLETTAPAIEKKVALSVENLTVCFPDKRNIFGKTISLFPAVKNVSFEVMKNETVGLVGESGCGKTTLGRSILQLVKPTSGKIILDGKDIAGLNDDQLRVIRKDLQIVFQDPYGSLNPRMTIGDAIMEPLNVHRIHPTKKQRKEQVVELLEKVSLQGDHFNRYPHQFSGGQRQRICIARALALQPDFLIFDESVSALDVSVQAQVLNLINDLKAEMNFSSIFISHDLSVVHYISDRILVMNKGRIVEEGSADDIYFNPVNDYTQQLVQAIPGKGLF